MMIWTRTITALLLAAVVTAPARALDFTPCTEQGHEAFDCATLPVPIDRDGTVPGTIDLHVERLRGQPPDLPVLVALAGGPGQSATSVRWDRVLTTVRDAVQLVVFDQRGTGLSGALESLASKCKKLAKSDKPPVKRRCDRQLGPAGAFYRTIDSVLDVDAVRAALGVERLIVLGVSYGTFVAAEYARRFPDRVQSLVLDSPVGPQGDEVPDVATAHASERVLAALCAGGACPGVTADPVADTAALVRRLARRPLRGKVRVPGKQAVRVALARDDLLTLLVAGDLQPGLRALYPAAVAAALEGDAAPVLRLLWLAANAEGPATRAAGDQRTPFEKESQTLYLATSCADTRFPWDAGDRRRRRLLAMVAAARTIPDAAPFPFDPATLVGYDVAGSCLAWPRTTLPGAVLLGPLPDVRVLVLAGEDDLRTPVENAAALAQGVPRAAVVAVPHQGHSVITSQDCAQATLARFLTSQPLGRLCDGVPRILPVQPVPRSFADLPEAPPLTDAAGRTLTAVKRTLVDALITNLVVNGNVSGLRGGTITCRNKCPATDRVLRLQRVSLIRGVAVSGKMRLGDRTWTASVTVRGRSVAAGSLEFGADRRITGRLGGQDVATTLSAEIAQLGAFRPGIPAIGRRPRPTPN
jgi:pimeloyl-ACP methyl ester carboxylesterase